MNKHFTFADRVRLQYFIETNPRPNAIRIAKDLHKSRGAVYYELKNNTTIHKTRNEIYLHNKDEFICDQLLKFPFCCNPCSNTRCSHKSRIYNAYDANAKANRKLVHSRIDTAHRRHVIETLDKQISQLIKDGQSIKVAMMSCSSVDLSESTIRRYINKDLLKARRIDLPNAVRFKVKKQYDNSSSSKISPRILYNRTHDDFLKYMEMNPGSKVVQVDSVIGKSNDKKALLTIFFMNSKLQFAFLYARKHSNINSLILKLYEAGIKHAYKLFDVIVTDNGTEFQKLIELEKDEDGIERFKVFYCDPYRSCQKAECERNHGFIRRIIKKGKSLDQISQETIDMAMSHINSYPRGSLKSRTPYNVFSSEYNSIILKEFNIEKIKIRDLKLK